jgi:hypothetical protein
MHRDGAGGTAMTFSHFLHYTYIMAKMEINVADAVGILKFLEEMGHKVGYPEKGLVYEDTHKQPYIKVLE